MLIVKKITSGFINIGQSMVIPLGKAKDGTVSQQAPPLSHNNHMMNACSNSYGKVKVAKVSAYGLECVRRGAMAKSKEMYDIPYLHPPCSNE